MLNWGMYRYCSGCIGAYQMSTTPDTHPLTPCPRRTPGRSVLKHMITHPTQHTRCTVWEAVSLHVGHEV